MRNRNHPFLSVLPHLYHPLQWGQSLVLDGSSADVMGPWEAGKSGGNWWEQLDANMPGASINTTFWGALNS